MQHGGVLNIAGDFGSLSTLNLCIFIYRAYLQFVIFMDPLVKLGFKDSVAVICSTSLLELLYESITSSVQFYTLKYWIFLFMIFGL